jgi:hypothetical protein
MEPLTRVQSGATYSKKQQETCGIKRDKTETNRNFLKEERVVDELRIQLNIPGTEQNPNNIMGNQGNEDEETRTSPIHQRNEWNETYRHSASIQGQKGTNLGQEEKEEHR